jgi:indole-3-glycerol phosphate synthase
MREWGTDAVLIGEALVTSQDIPSRIRELFDDHD